MENSQEPKKCWITPEVTVYGDIAVLTQQGKAVMKTFGLGDDLSQTISTV